MKILLDTNVIVGLSEKGRRQMVAQAIEKIHAQGHDMFVVPQVIYEFWVVATRPAREHGLELSTERAGQAIQNALQVFGLLHDPAEIYNTWFDLVKDKKVAGKQAHDARLAAAMAVHRLDAILTQNGRDFRRFSGITIIDPGHTVHAGS